MFQRRQRLHQHRRRSPRRCKQQGLRVRLRKGGADGDARLPARESIKQAAQTQPSRTQLTKESAAKALREEERERIKAGRRSLDLLEQQLDAEDVTALSDNDSHK